MSFNDLFSRYFRIALSIIVLSLVVLVAILRGSANPISLAAKIPPMVYAAIAICLFINAVVAAARFKFIVSHLGAKWTFWDAIAIVSASNVAGALFFQLAGQIAARSVLMTRIQSGSFANAVVITFLERISAAVVSGLGAVVGAYLIFGKLYFDWSDGETLVKLVVVGTLAFAGGVALSGASTFLLPRFDAPTLKLWAGSLLLSAGVQVPIMAAYMFAAHSLAANVSTINLLGATLVVMFAASMPISFGGWGIRELSAVVALGAVGMDPSQAVVTAVIIGLGSMLIAGLCAAITLPKMYKGRSRDVAIAERFNYTGWLSLALPVAVAVAVPFQIHLPINASKINVNLADPLALAGAVFFLVRCVSRRQWPNWRYRFLGVAALVTTLVIISSLIVGALDFGFTTWAVINRFVGWIILLGYVATAALAVMEHGEFGLRAVVGAFVGTIAIVASCELVLVLASSVVTLTDSIVAVGGLQGFAQNRNAFAFQLIMAVCVTLALMPRRWLTFASMAVFVSAIVLTFSRSGIGTLTAVLVLAAALDRRQRRMLIVSAAAAACAASAYAMVGSFDIVERLASTAKNLSERMETITGGIRLFEANPLFGSGLGAYRNEAHLAASGEPLVIHSGYVWLLAETGIIGLMAFLIPAVVIVVKEFRRLHSCRNAAATILCFVSMAMMNIPADMIYQRTFWLLAGALLISPVGHKSSNRAALEARLSAQGTAHA